VHSRWERLQLTINRSQYSQDLFFQSSESEEPYEQSLQPLVRWLDSLRKLPHKELSEDEGKQNCFPRSDIVLKQRGQNPITSVTGAPKSRPAQVLKAPPLASLSPARLGSLMPMLRVYAMSVNSSAARQFCVLITEGGTYRYEQRIQKTGKLVDTQVIS